MDTHRFIVRNRNAGIEGMPLMIIIIVVIAVAVLGIVLGWIFLASDSDPMIKKITVDPETVKTTTATVKVYVWDTDGNKVDGATVTVSGLNVNTAPVKTTKQAGDTYATVTLTGLALSPGAQTGTLSILAEKTGMGKKTLDVVVSV
jgi:hypothetical protein